MSEKLEHKGGIYMILSLIDNKKYIGEAKAIYKRWWQHRMNLKFNRHSNQHLQRAYNKYGKDNFIFHIIEVIPNSDKKERLEREKYWIEFYNTENQNFGYNYANTNIDEKLNKRKIRKKIISKRKLKKVIQLDLNNNYIKTWESVMELAKFYKKTVENMRHFIWTNKRPYKTLSHKGFIFIIEEYYDISKDYRPEKNCKKRIKKEKLPKVYKKVEDYDIKRNPISLQNINTGEIRHFKSHVEATEKLGFCPMSIRNLIKGYKNKGGGKIVKITQWKGWKIYKETV